MDDGGEPASAGRPDAGKDLDLDLHASVLTGQNSQATGERRPALSRRGGQFRALQLTGRLGRQPLTHHDRAAGRRAASS